MTSPCVSVILPVYNEEGNIAACLRGLSKALAGLEHEILVCYDFDEDTTLPAIARMEDKPAAVKLVRNTLGKGAAAAIQAGFQAARGDVLVVTMADLSDPPDVIPAMALKIREEGADVVSGSRYMKGGSQIGGPKIKTLLSRAAGLSLRWVAGMGTHDATTNFRAYSRRIIENTKIQSKYGMELALELTVKAHVNGFRVDEVASSWQDRSAGESRFRLWKWMPRYLRWYLSAMAEPLFVWSVLLGATIAALVFALRHAPVVPLIDEWFYIPLLVGRESLSLEWLWAQHNEHRIPLAKLVWFVLERLSGLDARLGVTVNVLLLAASSAILILALRRFRGQNAWTDAFVPLLFLHWDHWENMTWPFQIAFTLHHVVLSVLLAMILDLRRSRPSSKAPLFGVGLIVLALVGSSGLPFIALLAPWWIWTTSRERPRVHPVLSLGLPCLALAIAALQALAYRPLPHFPSTPGPGAAAVVAVQFLTGSLGFQGTRNWPVSGWMTVAALAATIGVLLKRSCRDLSGRGLLVTLGGLLILACLVGHARSGFSPFAGFWERYVTLACVFPFLFYAALGEVRPPLLARLARMSLLILMAFLFRLNGAHALDLLTQRRLAEESLLRDVDAGVPVSLLALRHRYWYGIHPSLGDFERDLRMLAEERASIFHKHPLPPQAIQWTGGPLKLSDGRQGTDLQQGGMFSPDLGSGLHRLRIEFGRLGPPAGEATLRASVRSSDGAKRTVWSSALKLPWHSETFEVTLQDGDQLTFTSDGAASSARYWLLVDAKRS
jgi:hypothetical protein